MELQAVRESVGIKLRRLRKAKNFTLRDLGEMIAFSHTHVSQVEKGNATASHAFLRKVSEVFAVPMAFWTATDDSQVNRVNKIETILGSGGDLEEALVTAKSLVRDSESGTQRGNALNLVGRVQLKMGKYKDGMYTWQAMRSEIAEFNDHGLMFSVYMNLALCAYYLVDYVKSLSLIEDALDICDQEDRKSVALQLQANIYADMNRFEHALLFHNELLSIYREQGNSRNILKSLHNIGDVELRLGHVQKAEKYFEEAHELAEIYHEEHDTENALKYYKIASTACKEIRRGQG